jgi:ribosomal protein L21E
VDVTQENEFHLLLGKIASGFFDNNIDQLEKAIDARRKETTLKVNDFEIGDRIAIRDTVSPKYLAGEKGIVVNFKKTRVVVDLDRPNSRFHKNVTIPPELLRIIS